MPADKRMDPKHSILVVEEDELLVKSLVNAISHDKRVEVKSATSGYDAGLLTEQFKPKLMVLNCTLPYVNAKVVCQAVRKNPSHLGMEIIIISEAVKQDTVESLLEDGANEFIEKRFVVEKVIERIKALL